MRTTMFICAVVLAVFGSSNLLRSGSIAAPAAAMPSLQELHKVAMADKLPNQQIDDMSLIFPN